MQTKMLHGFGNIVKELCTDPGLRGFHFWGIAG